MLDKKVLPTAAMEKYAVSANKLESCNLLIFISNVTEMVFLLNAILKQCDTHTKMQMVHQFT